ncbi:MBOAT family protein [Luteolibacter sp. Populi]|uniref:MBOAT family O-acyltransferase n=1 Tax=Luteolibacter sp. Populi TaxID=3230487 RepID=UPI003465D50F
MLFNSYTFLLLFLPVTLAVFLALRRAPFRLGLGWLVFASLVYYGVWNPDPDAPWSPKYLLLILGSCGANYLLGKRLSRLKHSRPGKILLATGVTANLLLLGYFKYAGFLAATATWLTGWPGDIAKITLPLAISFFTFLQIAYLVDAWKGQTEEYHFTDYLLFVTFFPHLIAGPLIHHREMMPQFRRKNRGWHRDFPVGLGIFMAGMFKKVVIADNMAPVANPIFALAAGDGRMPTMAEAWVGAVAYSLQLYFDFSGYSDMANGSARMFGIRFPLNFHSPYKAVSIVEFWRRWHMTLSRFLREYLYIPLGGNRKGPSRRYVNLFLTMLLGGLWHGAGWTFIAWGALHGLYLCFNHAWTTFRGSSKSLPAPLAVLLTFLAVLVGWVFFRAHDFPSAWRMLGSMAGAHGLSGMPDKANRVIASVQPLWVGLALLACWTLPNTQEIFARYKPALPVRGAPYPARTPRRWWQWRPTPLFALLGVGLIIVTGLQFDKVSEFIYFQF